MIFKTIRVLILSLCTSFWVISILVSAEMIGWRPTFVIAVGTTVIVLFWWLQLDHVGKKNQ
jgi:hypothetical protein